MADETVDPAARPDRPTRPARLRLPSTPPETPEDWADRRLTMVLLHLTRGRLGAPVFSDSETRRRATARLRGPFAGTMVATTAVVPGTDPEAQQDVPVLVVIDGTLSRTRAGGIRR